MLQLWRDSFFLRRQPLKGGGGVGNFFSMHAIFFHPPPPVRTPRTHALYSVNAQFTITPSLDVPTRGHIPTNPYKSYELRHDVGLDPPPKRQGLIAPPSQTIFHTLQMRPRGPPLPPTHQYKLPKTPEGPGVAPPPPPPRPGRHHRLVRIYSSTFPLLLLRVIIKDVLATPLSRRFHSHGSVVKVSSDAPFPFNPPPPIARSKPHRKLRITEWVRHM